MSGMRTCPICRQIFNGTTTFRTRVDCPNCLDFYVTDTALAMLESSELSERQRASISHKIYKMDRSQGRPSIGSDRLKELASDEMLPTLREQADLLLIHLAEKADEPGRYTQVQDVSMLRAAIGAADIEGVRFVLRHVLERGVVETPKEKRPGLWLGPTFAGWERYRGLRRSGPDYKRAFMAMDYKNERLMALFSNHLKPSVRQVGFDLRLLTEDPPAGSIVARLRAEIAESRFLVCDLTDDNGGAYWEAGYAEALGKPVIYLCEKRRFEKEKPHFDVSHCLFILWDAEDPGRAADELRKTIRATLPDEAIMTEDVGAR